MKILAARILAKKKTQGQPNFVGVVVPHPFARGSSFKTITKWICFHVELDFFVLKIICLETGIVHIWNTFSFGGT